MTSDWYEPDLTLRERLIGRASGIAVLVAMIALWARLIWLWRLGAIKSEPFFGSPEWNLAIVLPGATVLAASWMIARRRTRELERRITAVMSAEPLAGWHQRIRDLNSMLPKYHPEAPELEDAIRELTSEIVTAYPRLDAESRARVRLLWRTYERFAWHASVDWPVTTEGVRQALVLYSIRDQCTDARDEAVGLSELRDKARESGIDFATLAREVADLSDDTRRDPMFGSTRQLILRSAG